MLKRYAGVVLTAFCLTTLVGCQREKDVAGYPPGWEGGSLEGAVEGSPSEEAVRGAMEGSLSEEAVRGVVEGSSSEMPAESNPPVQALGDWPEPYGEVLAQYEFILREGDDLDLNTVMLPSGTIPYNVPAYGGIGSSADVFRRTNDVLLGFIKPLTPMDIYIILISVSSGFQQQAGRTCWDPSFSRSCLPLQRGPTSDNK